MQNLKLGAGLLEPTGTWHPVRFMEHEDAGLAFFKERYPDEAEAQRRNEGWVNGLRTLCDKHGWVRIATDGKVTNAYWDAKDFEALTQEQQNVIWDLFKVAKEKQAEGDTSTSLAEYIDNLRTCLNLDPYTEE